MRIIKPIADHVVHELSVQQAGLRRNMPGHARWFIDPCARAKPGLWGHKIANHCAHSLHHGLRPGLASSFE